MQLVKMGLIKNEWLTKGRKAKLSPETQFHHNRIQLKINTKYTYYYDVDKDIHLHSGNWHAITRGHYVWPVYMHASTGCLIDGAVIIRKEIDMQQIWINTVLCIVLLTLHNSH